MAEMKWVVNSTCPTKYFSGTKPLLTMNQPIAPCIAPNKNKITIGRIIEGLNFFFIIK